MDFFPIDLSTWPRGQMFYYFMLIGFTQLKKYIVNERTTFVEDRRERPVCRSESPINRPPTMIRAGCDNIPSQRHIGRSLRYII